MKRMAAMILALALLLAAGAVSAEAPEENTEPAVQVGDSVFLGKAVQAKTGNESIPIEWTVLDMRDGKALLITRYGINSLWPGDSGEDLTWETSKLRKWLNDGFLRWNFSNEEREAILATAVKNDAGQGYSGWDTDGGNDTEDRIFLLSVAEANRYFGVTPDNKENVRARVQPTEREAVSVKTGTETTEEGGAAAYWWLRSPGHKQNYAAVVSMEGALEDMSVGTAWVCVRPAMWVDADSEAVRAGLWKKGTGDSSTEEGTNEIRMLVLNSPTSISVRECGFGHGDTVYSVTLEGFDVLEAARKGDLSERIPFRTALAWKDGTLMERTSYGISYTGEPITILRYESGDGEPIPEPDYFLITEKDKDFSQGWCYVISESRLCPAADLGTDLFR